VKIKVIVSLVKGRGEKDFVSAPSSILSPSVSTAF
jgi:hypothetical protein